MLWTGAAMAGAAMSFAHRLGLTGILVLSVVMKKLGRPL